MYNPEGVDRTGSRRICPRPTNTVLTVMTTKAINRTIAVPDRAIWQIRQTGPPDEARSNSTVAWGSGPRRPQKCIVWTVVESRTAAKHTTAKQLNPFVDRYRRFTVLDATPDLDATAGRSSGLYPKESGRF